MQSGCNSKTDHKYIELNTSIKKEQYSGEYLNHNYADGIILVAEDKEDRQQIIDKIKATLETKGFKRNKYLKL